MTVRWEHEDGWKGKRGRSINSCRNIQVVFILIYKAALLRVLYILYNTIVLCVNNTNSLTWALVELSFGHNFYKIKQFFKSFMSVFTNTL